MTQPELMALYSMLSMSSVVAGVGHLGFLLPFLANPVLLPDDSQWLVVLLASAAALHRPARP